MPRRGVAPFGLYLQGFARVGRPAANQDIADDPSRNCNMLEIAEESEVSGVSWTDSRQASQDSSRLDFMRASLARASRGEIDGDLVAMAEVHFIWRLASEGGMGNNGIVDVECDQFSSAANVSSWCRNNQPCFIDLHRASIMELE